MKLPVQMIFHSYAPNARLEPPSVCVKPVRIDVAACKNPRTKPVSLYKVINSPVGYKKHEGSILSPGLTPFPGHLVRRAVSKNG